MSLSIPIISGAASPHGLVEASVNMIRERAGVRVILQVNYENAAAQRLYERSGFLYERAWRIWRRSGFVRRSLRRARPAWPWRICAARSGRRSSLWRRPRAPMRGEALAG